MDKITIGIPMALNYYRDYVLWKSFFEHLGIKVITSPPTNKITVSNGSKYLVDEACLSLKVFMGHVEYLKDKCDYVLVPRLNCVKKGQKLCTNFTAVYDLCNNVFKDVKFLNYNIDVDKGKSEVEAFLIMGKCLGFSYLKALKAYNQGVLQSKKYYKEKLKSFENKLNENKLKILIVGHPYNINDNFIGKGITDYLTNEGCTVLLSDIYDVNYDEKDANLISKKLYWTYNRELMAVISKYKNKIDGIVLLSTFPCGPDSLCNELIIRRVKNIPMLNLIVDGGDQDAGLITRLESFLDIIKIRKEHEKNG